MAQRKDSVYLTRERYRGRWRWRVTVWADGRSAAQTCADEGEARALYEAELVALGLKVDLTAGDLLDRWRDAHPHWSQATIDHARKTVARMIPRDLLVGDLTPARARDLYRAFAAPRASATHHQALQQARSAWRWARREQLVSSSPWESVQRIGTRNRGKSQLRISEARTLREYCLRDRSLGACATLIALMLGLRSRQILLLQVRDVDDDGRVLWVQPIKRRVQAQPMALEVPDDELRELLLEHTRGRAATEQLVPRHANYLQLVVRRLCDRAGVPRVSPHGLRGTFATTAAEQGVAARAVAAALTHASNGHVAEAHYIQQAATKRAQARQALKVLRGGKHE